jgi:hypothetical protein
VEERALSRIINTETIGKERTRLSKEIVLAIRELMQQKEPGPVAQDLAAFIVLALRNISGAIDDSVQAWEKRGYWVKADRFRMDWAWSAKLAETLYQALMKADWGGVAQAAVQIAMKLNKIEVSPNHRLGTPWVGAWNALQRSEQGQ